MTSLSFKSGVWCLEGTAYTYMSCMPSPYSHTAVCNDAPGEQVCDGYGPTVSFSASFSTRENEEPTTGWEGRKNQPQVEEAGSINQPQGRTLMYAHSVLPQTTVCNDATTVHVLKNVYAAPADTKHLTWMSFGFSKCSSGLIVVENTEIDDMDVDVFHDYAGMSSKGGDFDEE